MGYNFINKCTYSLTRLLSTLPALVFYDIYIYDSTQTPGQLYPVPVRILNYRDASGNQVTSTYGYMQGVVVVAVMVVAYSREARARVSPLCLPLSLPPSLSLSLSEGILTVGCVFGVGIAGQHQLRVHRAIQRRIDAAVLCHRYQEWHDQ